MASVQNQIIDTDSTNHGTAFYMLTGNRDFNYLIDMMISDGLVTEDDRSDLLTTKDGYRLRLMMVGMYKALDTTNDSERICLVYDEASVAICAGLKNDGTSIVPYATYYPSGAFKIASSSNTEPASGVDQSSDWFTQGKEGGSVVNSQVDPGNEIDSYWSVYKYQPLEEADSADYENDFRFDPTARNVLAYVMQYDATADTWNYYPGTLFNMTGAVSMSAMAAVAFVATSLMTF